MKGFENPENTNITEDKLSHSVGKMAPVEAQPKFATKLQFVK